MIPVTIDVQARTETAKQELASLNNLIRKQLGLTKEEWKKVSHAFTGELQTMVRKAEEASRRAEAAKRKDPETMMRARATAEATLAIEAQDQAEKKLNESVKEGIIYATEKGMNIKAMTTEQLAQYGEIEIATRKQMDLDAKAAQIKRQDLMMMSIGLFVVGITANQMLTTMQGMAGEGTLLAGIFEEMGTALKFMMAPLQVITALTQLLTMRNKELLLSSLPLLATFMAIYFVWRAMNMENKLMRALLLGLAGALMVLVAYWKLLNAQKRKEILADIISMNIKSLGVLGPVIAAAIIAAIGIAGIAFAALGQGQTIPGYSREVRDTGLFFAHKGEYVGRIGPSHPSSTGGGGVNINITIESGANVDDNTIIAMTQSIKRSLAAGENR